MKHLLILALLFGFSSCQAAQEAEDTAKKGAVDTVTAPNRARALQDLTTATSAIQTYAAQNNNTYPPTLEELKLNLNNPADMSYDPKTGKVHSKSYPNL